MWEFLVHKYPPFTYDLLSNPERMEELKELQNTLRCTNDEFEVIQAKLQSTKNLKLQLVSNSKISLSEAVALKKEIEEVVLAKHQLSIDLYAVQAKHRELKISYEEVQARSAYLHDIFCQSEEEMNVKEEKIKNFMSSVIKNMSQRFHEFSNETKHVFLANTAQNLRSDEQARIKRRYDAKQKEAAFLRNDISTKAKKLAEIRKAIAEKEAMATRRCAIQSTYHHQNHQSQIPKSKPKQRQTIHFTAMNVTSTSFHFTS